MQVFWPGYYNIATLSVTISMLKIATHKEVKNNHDNPVTPLPHVAEKQVQVVSEFSFASAANTP